VTRSRVSAYAGSAGTGTAPAAVTIAWSWPRRARWTSYAVPSAERRVGPGRVAARPPRTPNT